MTPFQYVTLGMLGAVLTAEVVRGLRSSGPHRVLLVRCLVWIAAGLGIAFPELVQVVAVLLGIGRGADVVLYLFVLLFLGTAFFLYARLRRQQQQVTELVRHLALLDARRGRDAAPPPAGTAESPPQ